MAWGPSFEKHCFRFSVSLEMVGLILGRIMERR
jgi:hypothetical protein